MNKGRLEAFSDGVIAILITIMVLELKTPEGSTWQALRPLVPILLTYVLSFVFLGIYWNNHHHLLQATEHVNGRILWANLHLLFWLSLTPFAMGWMGENTAAAAAHRGLRHGSPGLGDRVLDSAARDPRGPGSTFPVTSGPRTRPQGQHLARLVHRRHRPRVRKPVDLGRDLRLRRAHVACSRSADRTVGIWE